MVGCWTMSSVSVASPEGHESTSRQQTNNKTTDAPLLWSPSVSSLFCFFVVYSLGVDVSQVFQLPRSQLASYKLSSHSLSALKDIFQIVL